MRSPPPGVDVLLPAPDAAYQVTTGTSFAAAEVSGIAALLLERRPDLGPAGVRKALTATARDLGPKGIDPQFGAGLVDAYQAILSLRPAPAGTAAGIVPPPRASNALKLLVFSGGRPKIEHGKMGSKITPKPQKSA